MSGEQSAYTIPFNQSGLEDTPRVGGKNASLGELIKAGINVPPGYAVSTAAYNDFFKKTRINQEIHFILNELIDLKDRKASERISQKICRLIESNSIPSKIRKSIVKEYEVLCQSVGIPRLPVDVRSSCTAEDLLEASLAGQHDTFLFVRDPDEVVEKTVKCWASAFTPRAILYRMKMGIPHARAFMSVGVQMMVNAFSAGVMFTLDPVSGDRSVVAIDASFGIGESVVKGEVTPDQYIVDKIELGILKKDIKRKEIKYTCIADEVGLICEEVDEDLKERPALIDEEIEELTEIAKKIETHYGKAMDIEWAIEKEADSIKGRIYVLQARPETVWNLRWEEWGGKQKDLASAFLDGFLKGR